MGNHYKYDLLGSSLKLTAPSGETILLCGEEVEKFFDELNDLEDSYDEILERSEKEVSLDDMLDKMIDCYF